MFNVLYCRDDLNNLYRMRLPCHKRFLDKAPWRQFADVPCDIRVREQTTKYLQQDIAHAHLYFICFSLLVVAAAVPSFLPIQKSDGHVSVTECLEVEFDSVCWRVIPISCVRDKIHFWLGLYCWLAGASLHHHHMSRPPYIIIVTRLEIEIKALSLLLLEQTARRWNASDSDIGRRRRRRRVRNVCGVRCAQHAVTDIPLECVQRCEQSIGERSPIVRCSTPLSPQHNEVETCIHRHTWPNGRDKTTPPKNHWDRSERHRE